LEFLGEELFAWDVEEGVYYLWGMEVAFVSEVVDEVLALLGVGHGVILEEVWSI